MQVGETHHLIRFLDEQVEALRQLLPQVVEDFDASAIHQSRVATRRLKAGLDLFEPFVDAKRFRVFSRFTRRLRKRLGPMRDLDVMKLHLKELVGGALSKQGVDILRKQFTQRQTKLRGKLLHEVDDVYLMEELGGWWAVRQQLSGVVDAARSRLAEQIHNLIDEFRRDAGVVCGTAESEKPVDVHELRIVGKSLRYTLEMAVRTGHPVPDDVTKLFKAMQDDLGLWHDFAVLAQHVVDMSSNQQTALHDAPQQLALVEVVRASLKKSEASIARFRAKWKARGQALVPKLHAAVPLSKPVNTPETPARDKSVTESKTDHDPSSPASVEASEAPSPVEPTVRSEPPARSSNAARKRPSPRPSGRVKRRDGEARP